MLVIVWHLIKTRPPVSKVSDPTTNVWGAVPQARIEGRHLGGRPPYGYRLVDAGPHPNRAKASGCTGWNRTR